MQIERYRDTVKLSSDDLHRIIAQAVEKELGRKVYQVKFHSGGRTADGIIGAATVELMFSDEK